MRCGNDNTIHCMHDFAGIKEINICMCIRLYSHSYKIITSHVSHEAAAQTLCNCGIQIARFVCAFNTQRCTRPFHPEFTHILSWLYTIRQKYIKHLACETTCVHTRVASSRSGHTTRSQTGFNVPKIKRALRRSRKHCVRCDKGICEHGGMRSIYA